MTLRNWLKDLQKNMILIIPQIKYPDISGITLFPFIILRDKQLKEDKQKTLTD
jgi:hypothetical protein